MAVVMLAALAGASAFAQGQVDAQKRPASTSSPEDKQEAEERFHRGVSLMQQQAWAPALAEFQISRKKFPTGVATINAAECLKQLKRYDEALEMFESLLREFPDIDRDDKQDAQIAIVELRQNVGTIEIVGGAAGAIIFVDNRERGEYPPVNPIRVSAGEHVVRLMKDGFQPVETRVDVAGGKVTSTKPLRMLALRDTGKLRVTEPTGKKVDVLVDGLRVGEAPWEGSVSVGRHMVLLRGEGLLGTAPVSASVKSGEITALALKAEELDAFIQIVPTPAGAQVALDSIVLGNGSWEGPVRSGAHKIEVRAEGFTPVVRSIDIPQGDQKTLSIKLERDNDAEVWQKPSKLTMDATAGFVMIPSLGGDLSKGCSGECSQSFGVGALGLVNAVYELGSGLGFGISGGYLLAAQSTSTRESTLKPNGLGPIPGVVDDRVRLTGWMMGGTLGYRVGEATPLLARLGVGFTLGTVRDRRTGQFPDVDGRPLSPYPVADFAAGNFIYALPEVRIARRFGENWEVGAFLQGLALIAVSQPRFEQNDNEVNAPGPSLGTYANDTLTDSLVFAIVPGLSVRYVKELSRKRPPPLVGKGEPTASF